MSNPLKAIRAARGNSQTLSIALLLLTCGALSAQTQDRRVRNIVLVHGAWADGSGWKGVLRHSCQRWLQRPSSPGAGNIL